ncbi:sensor histidine kinase [Rhabdochromatium marinum]|uniref:sensor histidine kinase n=1 Tax=Rhabdochromatium marinum TaxID=48729 RepID=UPI0019063C01|nr:ATP-binding protein [Rhabdochromatium marinum]MBK1649881.1 histidine kinase [Rhabdochromatium marinum]
MKLAYKLLLPITAIFVLGFAALYTLSVRTEQTVINAFEQKADAVILEQLGQQRDQRLATERGYLAFVARMAAQVAVEFVSNMNYAGIEQPIRELLALQGVEAVHVFDATTDQTFVAAYRKEGQPVVGSELPPGLAPLRELRHRMTDRFEDREVDYGYISIYYNNAHLLDEIAAMERASLDGIEQIKEDIQSAMSSRLPLQIGGFALAALLLTSAVFALVFRFILQPLRTLHHGLDSFFAFLHQRQDHIAPIELASRDEFGDMARSLNRNIEVSATLHRSISSLNENLELKVKQRTHALSEINEKLELSLDSGRMGTFNWHIDSNHNFIDARWARMLGYQPEELDTSFSGWKALTHPDDTIPTQQRIEDYLAGKTPDYEAQFRMRAKSGDYVWILARGKTVAWDAEGRPQRLAGTHMDISHIKEVEHRLCEATERAEQALVKLQEMQTQLIHAEKMAALGHLIAGIAHEINTPLGVIQSSGSNITHALGQALVGLPELYVLLTADEQALFLELLEQAQGGQRMLSSREARQYCRAHTKALEQAEVPRARKVADMLVQLGVLEAPARFLPLMRHPRADFILETAYSLATVIVNAANINHAVERAGKIVQALKSFAHHGASGERSETDVRENIETVLTLYHNQIKQNVELVRHYAEAPPLLAYPDELCQVWTNLIQNALQAMDYCGTLTITLALEDGAVQVTVTDTGSGITPEVRERIFEPFFTTKRAGEGTGLGLDIVARIVARHQGRIDLDSTPGVGTTFRVSLPYLETKT